MVNALNLNCLRDSNYLLIVIYKYRHVYKKIQQYNPKKYILALQLKSNKNCIYNNKININKDDFRLQYGCQSY